MSRSAVLVVGGAGLVGRHVAAAFPPEDTSVTYHVARLQRGIALDITDRARVTAFIEDVRPDVILLAAAEPHVERCEREPEATRATNVDAARTIAEAARRIGALLVVFSSEYVFDGSKGRYVEDDAPAPLNEYGRQKAELEAIARSVSRHLICRASGVFGWEPARKNFVCQVLDRLRAGREFVVPSDQLITPTYAPYLGRAVARLVAQGASGTIHVVGPQIVPRVRFAQLICRVFGLDDALLAPRPTEDLGLAAARPRRAGLADDRLRRLLGGALPPLEEALAEMRASEELETAGLHT